MECQIFVNFIGNIGTKNWMEQKILQQQWKINERDSITFPQLQTTLLSIEENGKIQNNLL